MSESANEQVNELVRALQERAKELNCLYGVEEILNEPDVEPGEAFRRILRVIPPGWQYPDICTARIKLGGETCESEGFRATPWKQRAEIRTQTGVAGSIEVYYKEPMPQEDEGPFLKEEARLIRTIADRIGHYYQHFLMKRHFDALKDLEQKSSEDWKLIQEVLRRTDKDLYEKVILKLLHHLSWAGIREAEALLEESHLRDFAREDRTDGNRPLPTTPQVEPSGLGERVFRIAAQHFPRDEILALVQKWVREDRISFLASSVERNLPLAEIADAIRRYCRLEGHEGGLSKPTGAHVRVALIRRFLSEHLPFIRTAKEYLDIEDFDRMVPRIIASPEAHGRLGGKSAGLILASKILQVEREQRPELGEVRTPKTWYISSDMHVHFMHYNNLDDVSEQKYKSIDQIRFEYPHIVHSCKNSRFPQELINGLSVALDDFGERPLIVRSSSVLEDRIGAAFSGKYKSLFVANRGTKQERLSALLDAIAEVYASMFSPDPIQYRRERGLIDFAEEMGIIIQEVVGQRVGPYWFPLFAGVALSRNEFRWSPRIQREDGIIRLVPGLGTRAVDRIGDDYAILFAPGQPSLRVNVTPDEVLRYSPRYLDAINVETGDFVTLDALRLIAERGAEYPMLHRLISVYRDRQLRPPGALDTDLRPEEIVITFEGLLTSRAFVEQARAILAVLEERMDGPVDVEFAHDGKRVHLLQCRSQGHGSESAPAPIPKDVPKDRILFTASRHVSNGLVGGITHVVYVDPERYAGLSGIEELRQVGRAVGELNKLLPKRQFILMGPGRWGSRGDIKLGVSVTYADISNTALLIEIARRKGNYTPDLSFGTHFFQDLVEASIRYLPLYPDEDGSVFNERFMRGAANILSEILPSHASLSEVLRVIDVQKVAEGQVLNIYMNAELDEALGVIEAPTRQLQELDAPTLPREPRSPEHSRWRMRMAEQLARSLDPGRYGVRNLYVFGSTKNFTAGPSSDIDLLVHVSADPRRRAALEEWLNGWSLALDEINFLRTGYRTGGLLDVHFLTDEDIRKKSSYAVKIGAVTDAAKPLPLGSRGTPRDSRAPVPTRRP